MCVYVCVCVRVCVRARVYVCLSGSLQMSVFVREDCGARELCVKCVPAPCRDSGGTRPLNFLDVFANQCIKWQSYSLLGIKLFNTFPSAFW